MNAGKEAMRGPDVVNEDSSLDTRDLSMKSKWARVQEIIWDRSRPAEEKRLVQRLNLFLM
jgi:hypothetical protein